jgi:hypothetical protein
MTKGQENLMGFATLGISSPTPPFQDEPIDLIWK